MPAEIPHDAIYAVRLGFCDRATVTLFLLLLGDCETILEDA